MATIRFNVANDLNEISAATERIEHVLNDFKTKPEESAKAVFLVEECMVKLSEMADASDMISVKVRKSPFATSVTLTQRGKEISLIPGIENTDINEIVDEYGPEAAELIRDLVLKNTSDRVRIQHRKGINTVTIMVTKIENAELYYTFFAMLSGIAVGLLCRFTLPMAWSNVLCEDFFTLLYNLFLTAIKMIVGPLVFFSIAASISGFSDLKALGRTAGKVFVCYLVTTTIAITIALGCNFVIDPGRPGMIDVSSASGVATETAGVSIIDTLISIIPDNFIGAFASGNMLQLIFLAVLVGIAAGQAGRHSEGIRTAIDAISDLFGTITAIISHFLPLAIFGSMATMTAQLDAKTIATIMMWGVSFLTAIVLLVLGYMCLLIVGRINPLQFIRKYYRVPLTGLLTSSSSATIPTSLDCCRSLGISPRIYSFSIPLGASINMDGTSMFFTTASLFLAGLYGIHVDCATMLTFITTVLLLSVAAPGVPGAGTACILILLNIIGVPAEGFALLIGLAPLLELFGTAANVLGDGVVATLVAKSEKALDLETFNA